MWMKHINCVPHVGRLCQPHLCSGLAIAGWCILPLSPLAPTNPAQCPGSWCYQTRSGGVVCHRGRGAEPWSMTVTASISVREGGWSRLNHGLPVGQHHLICGLPSVHINSNILSKSSVYTNISMHNGIVLLLLCNAYFVMQASRLMHVCSL